MLRVMGVVLLLALTVQSDQGVCPTGWLPFNKQCFLFIENFLKWDDAQKHCEKENGWLVHDDNKEKHDWIAPLMKDKKTIELWTGGAKNNAGEWQWKPNSQKITVSFWAPGEPSSHRTEGCTALQSNRGYMWNNQRCINKLRFICEKKMAKSNVPQPIVQRPIVQLPNVQQPNVQQLKVQLPNVQLPNVQKPNVQLPIVQKPNVQLPNVQKPNVQLPNVQQPNVQLPNVQKPNVQQPNVQLPNVQQPNVQQTNVQLSKG